MIMMCNIFVVNAKEYRINTWKTNWRKKKEFLAIPVSVKINLNVYKVDKI